MTMEKDSLQPPDTFLSGKLVEFVGLLLAEERLVVVGGIVAAVGVLVRRFAEALEKVKKS